MRGDPGRDRADQYPGDDGQDPEAVGLGRYAMAGRLLAGLAERTTDIEARRALIDLLSSWTETLGAPDLHQLGLEPSDIASVVAGVSVNSMRTNPIELTPTELREILES